MSLYAVFEKQYGDFHLRVDLSAENGVTGILGASGSGKSLTLKCIAGVERPDRGHIELDGVTLFDSEKHINLPPQKRGVGYLFQSYALFPNMTVQQNIRCGVRNVRDRSERARLCEQTVRLLGLEGLEKHLPHQLSGGQQQRVALARILVNRPKLLMLDEPFSALDSQLRDRLRIECKRILAAYGGPSLLVTHDRDEAFLLCSQIATADSGRLNRPRSTEALFLHPKTEAEARMTGCRNILKATYRDAHHAVLSELGVTVETAEALKPSLTAIGMREKALHSDEPHNCLTLRVCDELRKQDSKTLLLMPETGGVTLFFGVPYDAAIEAGETVRVGIAPKDLIPLYPNGPV